MKKGLLSLAAVAVLWSASPQLAEAHCQIPCGIYHDDMVFHVLDEDVETVAKMVEMMNVSECPKKSQVLLRNQFTRAVTNKDTYADKIAHTISEYFLQQRIKMDDPDLQKKLAGAHKVLVLAMKVKQAPDEAAVGALKDSLEAFKALMAPQIPPDAPPLPLN